MAGYGQGSGYHGQVSLDELVGVVEDRTGVYMCSDLRKDCLTFHKSW